MIESVQKQTVIFLRNDYINRSENNYVLPPYNLRCNSLDSTTLIRRKINAAVIFIHKIISGKINAPAETNWFWILELDQFADRSLFVWKIIAPNALFSLHSTWHVAHLITRPHTSIQLFHFIDSRKICFCNQTEYSANSSELTGTREVSSRASYYDRLSNKG